MAMASAPETWAATLGMFIIDIFRFEDPQTGQDLGDRGLGDQIGGGGTYFAIGARVWLDPENISMTIDRGSDFPQAIQDKLNTFSKGSNGLWRWRERKQGGTTRAVNIYRGEQRGFEYLSEKIRLDPIHLLEEAAPSGNVSGNLPRFIHFICSPQRALQIVDQVDELQDHWNDRKRPKLVWEPIPDSAKAENLDDCIRVMQRIDVISPNHEEAASFLSVSLQDILSPASVLSTAHICATLARRLAVGLAERCPPSLRPLVCIRAGKYGSAVLVPSSAAVEGSKDQMGWAEAYHTESDSHRVLDVTGAGNAWLGGFVASLVLHDREKRQRGSSESWSLGVALKAAMMGSVSASFIVEQQGLPDFKDGKWNSESPQERLIQLQSRAPVSLDLH